MREGGGGGRSPRLWDRWEVGGRPGTQKIFSALRASFWSKNMGGTRPPPPAPPLDPPLLDTDLVSRRTFRVTPGSITASEFDSSFFFSCHTDRNSRRSPHFITAINKILVNGVTCCMKGGSTFSVFFKFESRLTICYSLDSAVFGVTRLGWI